MELLIVIVVIAILAAITIVAYNGIQNRANNAAVESDLAAAAKYLEIRKVELERYPVAGTVAEMPAGFKLTKSAYVADAASHNAMYCVNRVTDKYAFGVISKSGQHYILNSGVVSKVPNMTSTTVCEAVGATWENTANAAVIHGYNSGTQTWNAGWVWTN